MADETQPTSGDPIDWARYFWKERGFPGDENRFLAMSSLLRYQRLVQLSLEAKLKEFDLNPTDYMLLMSLEFHKDRTRLVGALARTLMVHATTATLAVDRLEGRGLLIRNAHPGDRRATLVSITKKGSKLARQATAALQEAEFGLTSASDADVKQFLDVLKSLRGAVGDTESL